MKKYFLTPILAKICNFEKDRALRAPDVAQHENRVETFSPKPLTLTLAVFIAGLLFSQAAFAARTITSISITSGQSTVATYGTAATPSYTITLVEGGGGGSVNDLLTVSGLPAGVTMTPAALATTGFAPTGSGQTVSFILNTSTTTPAGSYTITVNVQDKNNGVIVRTTTGTLVIGQRILSVNGLSAGNKVYNGTTTATVTGLTTLSNVLVTDLGSVNLSGTPVGTFSPDGNVGTGKTVNVTGYTLTGSAAGNYSLTQPSLTANITAAPLTITATGPTKTYGTALTTGASTINFTASAAVSGEAVTSVTLTPNAAGLSATTAAGAAYTVTPSAPTGTGGFLASNYSITFNIYNGTVAKAPLTITATGPVKTYGTALTAGAGTSFSVSGSLATGQNVTSVTLTPTGPGITAAAAAGTAYTVTPSAATGTGGFLAANYTITYAPYSGTVGQAPLTLTANAVSKVYGSTLTGAAGSSAFTRSALQNGENITSVTINYGTGGTATATVAGSPYNTIVASAPIGGGTFNASNYAITVVNGNVTVTPITITVSGAAASNKVYDGTTTATVTGTPVGLVNGDVITLAGTFASPNVANGIAVTATISGANATSYTLTQPAPALKANITLSAITITATGPVKTYGTALTAGAGTSFSVSGSLATGQNVTSVTLTPTGPGITAAAAAGTAYTVTPSAATGTGGFLAANYTITYAPYSGTVGQAPLTLTANAVSKVYGSTLTGAAGSSAFTRSALQNGENITSVTINYGTGGTATATVAGSPYNTIVASAPIGGGTFNASNYAITVVNGNVTVTPKTITVSGAAASNKVYDGTTTATVTGTPVGLVNGDVITFAGTFASPNVTNGIAVTATISGANATSYTLTQPTPALKANITPAPLTITAISSTKVYGSTVPTGINIFGTNVVAVGPAYFTTIGTVNGETVTQVYFFYSGTGSAATAPVGSTYSATPNDIFGLVDPTGAGGFDVDNYDITYTPATVTVVPAPITITAALVTKPLNTTLATPKVVTSGFSAVGLQNAQTITSITENYGSARLAAATTGDYPGQVTPSGPFTGSFTPSNYTITYVSGDLAVLGTFDWIGTGPDKNWSTPLNWSFNGVPQTTQYPGQNGTPDVVTIGVIPFTNQPTVDLTTLKPISTLTFGNQGSVVLTFSALTILTTTSDVTFNSGSNVTVAGVGNATFNFGGNFSNSGTVAITGNTLFNFDGSAGALTTISPVTFTNVAFSGGGATAISSGAFAISSTGLLTMSNGTVLVTGSHLTLNSDATGSATVAAIPSGSSVSGTVTVQRFIKGSSGDLSKRGYRLLSSPVYTGNDGTSNVTDLQYLTSYTFVSGLGNAANGFNIPTTTNPTIYLFREDDTPPPNNTTVFTTGYNWKGVAKINGSPLYNIGTQKKLTITNVADTTATVPSGNGFLFFFRGNNTPGGNGTTAGTQYTSPYNYPDDVTLSHTGTLNTGTIPVTLWYGAAAGLGSNLSYTSAYTNTSTYQSDLIGGFNLVGNPYASTINWEKYNNTAAPGALTGTVSNIIYEFNENSKTYDSYIATQNPNITSERPSGSGLYTGSGTNLIASGQGFFVQSTATGQTLTFTENAKVNTLTSPILLADMMGVPNTLAAASPLSLLRMRMTLDSLNADEILISFKNNSSSKFVRGEDAIDLGGNGALENLSVFSSDSVKLAITQTPFPGAKAEVIPMEMSATSSGTYTLTAPQLENIPQLYSIWLKDSFKGDSVNLRKKSNFSFTIDKNNPATFGSRFSVIIAQDTAYAYHLLNFTAARDGVLPYVQTVWKTTNEENYTNFTVERSTDAGKTFTIIGGLKGTDAGTYSLLDKSPVTGRNLYRLKQEDINNAISYSKIVAIEFAFTDNQLTKNKINIYPNPSTGPLNMIIDPESDQPAVYNIKFMNSSGIIVREFTSSNPTWQGSISNLLPGTYIVRVINLKAQSFIGENKFIKL